MVGDREACTDSMLEKMYNRGESVRNGESFCGFASGVVNKKLGPMMVPDEVPSIFD
jgi:hypothetical protein